MLHLPLLFDNPSLQLSYPGDLLEGELEIVNHLLPPLLHVRTEGSVLDEVRVEQVSFFLDCFHDVFLKIGEHDLRKLFEIIVDDFDSILTNCSLPDPQHVVLLNESFLIDVFLFR